jgi:hypothetical protein
VGGGKGGVVQSEPMGMVIRKAAVFRMTVFVFIIGGKLNCDKK